MRAFIVTPEKVGVGRIVLGDYSEAEVYDMARALSWYPPEDDFLVAEVLSPTVIEREVDDD